MWPSWRKYVTGGRQALRFQKTHAILIQFSLLPVQCHACLSGHVPLVTVIDLSFWNHKLGINTVFYNFHQLWCFITVIKNKLIQDLKSNKTATAYCKFKCATIEPLGISCLTGLCCRSQVIQSGWTIAYFLHLEDCIAPLDTMKASFGGGGFQIRSR